MNNVEYRGHEIIPFGTEEALIYGFLVSGDQIIKQLFKVRKKGEKRCHQNFVATDIKGAKNIIDFLIKHNTNATDYDRYKEVVENMFEVSATPKALPPPKCKGFTITRMIECLAEESETPFDARDVASYIWSHKKVPVKMMTIYTTLSAMTNKGRIVRCGTGLYRGKRK